MPRHVVFYPIAHARIPHCPAEEIPQKISREIGKKYSKDEHWQAPWTKEPPKDNPETCERRDVSEEYCGEIDNKISQKEILTREEADGRCYISHAY